MLLSMIGIFFLQKDDSSSNKRAIVYYKNDVILEIDLTKKEKNTYQVEGNHGPVTIVSEYGKVKVESENSPLHLCSKQGYISSSYESIVCLPNEIVVTIDSYEEIDAIVK